MKTLLFVPLFVPFLATGVLGCDEGVIPSAPVADAGAVSDAGGTDGAVVRTVETRNPFGDTTNAQNLMIDGDFELTGRSQQMPWIAFDSSGQATLGYATGGRCRSGVRCATVPNGTQLIGYFASPKTEKMTASVWTRPDSGSCNDVDVDIVDLNDQNAGFAAVLKAGQQDAAGWCNFTGQIPNLADKQPVVYVAPRTGNVRVDDAVILPSADGDPAQHSAGVPTSATREHLRFIAEWVRTHRRFDAPKQAHEVP